MFLALPKEHRDDESGRAQIKVANEDQAMQAGSIVYVAKNLEHRFHLLELTGEAVSKR